MLILTTMMVPAKYHYFEFTQWQKYAGEDNVQIVSSANSHFIDIGMILILQSGQLCSLLQIASSEDA